MNHSLNSTLKRFFDAFPDNTQQGYQGQYGGLGISGPDIWVPHRGLFDAYDFIQWVHNNPEAAQLMVNTYLNFLKQFENNACEFNAK